MKRWNKFSNVPQPVRCQFQAVRTDYPQKHKHGPHQKHREYAIVQQLFLPLEQPIMNSHMLALADHMYYLVHTESEMSVILQVNNSELVTK